MMRYLVSTPGHFRDDFLVPLRSVAWHKEGRPYATVFQKVEDPGQSDLGSIRRF